MSNFLIQSPLVDPISWMSITVSGQTIGPKDGTGLVKIKRAGRPYKWQTKDASGQEGATKTYLGKKPPDFEIEFHMWTDSQFDAWQTISSTSFLYDASKTSVEPTDVFHPALQMVGISQVVVDDLGAPEQQGDKLYWIATVKVSEYFPPILQNITQTPPGAASENPNAPGGTPDSAISNVQQLIDQAKAQVVNDGILSPQGSGLP